VDPALAYGPDDPAYGPPGPDWYRRDEERGRDEEGAPRPEDVESRAEAGESRVTRGPFEPLRPGDREEAAQAGSQPGGGDAGEPDAGDAGDPDVGAPETEISEYGQLNDEMPELFDFGTPTDPEAGALGQIRDLYQTAEGVSQASLDRHFDELLERQRELITEYFQESGGLAETVAPAAPADPSVPLGFDTAESLAALRGELRGASE
jgi:hypothetical protein